MAPTARRSASMTIAALAASPLAACGSASVVANAPTQASAASSTSTPMTGIFGSNPIQSVAVHDACKAEVMVIQTALEASYAMNNRYASSLGALVRDGLLRADADVTASSGTTMTHTSAPGTFSVRMTADGSSVTVTGTVDGKPC